MECAVLWDADLDVQRTIKGAELTAFLCLFRKDHLSHHVPMLTTKGSLTGCGEEK